MNGMADLRPSLTEVAIRGSALTTVQTIVNKAAALAASVVLAKLLDPADYGVAFTATTLGAFLFILAPWVLNDLLVSRPKHFEEEAGTALAVGMTTSIVLGRQWWRGSRGCDRLNPIRRSSRCCFPWRRPARSRMRGWRCHGHASGCSCATAGSR